MSTVSSLAGTAECPARGGLAVAGSGASALTMLFAAALFVSSALLFAVEPMFAKMVLPRLGGSPAVWNTCVVFFQGTMMAAYVYAHLAGRWLPLRWQAIVHVALAAAAGLMLPVAIPEGWTPPAGSTPVPALLMLLGVSIGGPFFAVSSTAPLLQKWFSQTNHASARDPYSLYAASNLGSIVALLAYPFLVEPSLSLSGQTHVWAVAYAGFVMLTIGCAVGATRGALSLARPAVARPEADGQTNEPLTWVRRARWLTLALVPSSLLLGVTTFVSTDLAPMPLLWTVPLVLYLLTFVVAFAMRRLVPTNATRRAAVVLVMPLVPAILIDVKEPSWLMIPLHLTGFFACALALHARLADDRPGTAHLTEFYFWIALGGLAGGMFNTLLAPLLFSSIAEYPLMLVLAASLVFRGARRAGHRLTAADIALPLAAGGAAMGTLMALKGGMAPLTVGLGIGAAGMLCAACTKNRVRLALALVVIVLGVSSRIHQADLLYADRTFFGVLRVSADAAAGRHRLLHGSTLHGEQSVDPVRRREPLTYYHRTGPIGQTIEALSQRLRRVAVVGLGAGSLAAYATPGQQWTFYELDPAVARIARTPALFTYLQDCGERCGVILGDARLSLERRRDVYDLIVLDAFSSDAVPVHLITREAVALYLSRLSADGVIAFHISNRYLDLRPVIAALASELGLQTRVQLHSPARDSGAMKSLWVVAARNGQALGALASDPRWTQLPNRPVDLWSDDYSNILSVLGRP